MLKYAPILLLLVIFSSCSHDDLLLHKKWRVYDVIVPPGSGEDFTQINTAKQLKDGYYTNVYYQFLDNNLFIATIDNKPDSGKYQMLSNGKIISVTANNGDRKVENLVTVVKLDATHFDMQVKSGEYYFILKTKAE